MRADVQGKSLQRLPDGRGHKRRSSQTRTLIALPSFTSFTQITKLHMSVLLWTLRKSLQTPAQTRDTAERRARTQNATDSLRERLSPKFCKCGTVSDMTPAAPPQHIGPRKTGRALGFRVGTGGERRSREAGDATEAVSTCAFWGYLGGHRCEVKVVKLGHNSP